MVGGEVSPYGIRLGVTYPTPDIDALLKGVKAVLPAWRNASVDTRAGVCLEILFRLNRRSVEIAFAVMHTTGQAFMRWRFEPAGVQNDKVHGAPHDARRRLRPARADPGICPPGGRDRQRVQGTGQARLVARAGHRPRSLSAIRHGAPRRRARCRRHAGGIDDTSLRTVIRGVAGAGFWRQYVDRTFVSGLAEEMPYDVPNYHVDYVIRATPVPLGVWRAINYTQNAFYKECFVDEMAHAAGVDPYQFRRRLLANSARNLGVLDAVARQADWGGALPAGVYRGIALNEACGSYCAQVVEASVTDGQVRVHRVISAIDPGHVVNPLSVQMQTQGAVVYALTAALYGEITIKDGAAEQSNFDSYEMLRIADAPQVETVIVPSGGFWGGVGEPPVPPLAPALCNAIFAATGKRIRSLPLKNHDLRAI